MDRNLREMLTESARAIHVPLTMREVNLFDIYYKELVFWNKKINLVSTDTPQDIIIKHFIDSLTPVPFIPCPGGRLLDIGSGGGFPGIPLKIVLTSLQVVLLESSRKKTSYLKHMIRCLQLSQTLVLHARAEQMMQDASLQATFDMVISRAAFKLPKLLEMAHFFLAPQGWLIAMKGPNFKEEPGLANTWGFVCAACHPIAIPHQGGQRKLLIFQRDI